MLIAYHIGFTSSDNAPSVAAMLRKLKDGGAELYEVGEADAIRPGTDVLLSIGGDGTFLTSVRIVADSGVPIAGVNTGHLGFLSAYKPEDVAEHLLEGRFSIEGREVLKVSIDSLPDGSYWPYAFNEAGFRISAAGMMGIDLSVGGAGLPTYWADGLLVATSSGSTGYALSVGGPICLPDVSAHIIAPIAPHNFNVRPLIVPSDREICLSCHPRRGDAVVFMDNRSYNVKAGTTLSVTSAPFRVGKLVFDNSNFITALRTKLFWGEDRRNER